MARFKVDYDEIVHRTCYVDVDTFDEVEDAVTDGDTDEDYETDSGTRLLAIWECADGSNEPTTALPIWEAPDGP